MTRIGFNQREGNMKRSVIRSALGATVAALATLAPQALAAAENVNFVGTWKLSNHQAFTIKQENRRTGACSGTTALSKLGPYKLVACHVKGNRYAFTITYGASVQVLQQGHDHGEQADGQLHGHRRQRRDLHRHSQR